VSGTLISGGETSFDDVTSPLPGALVLGVTAMLAFGIQGAAIGLAQGIALRHAFARPGRWVVATGGGWAMGGAISGGLAGSMSGAMTGVGPDAGVAGVVVTFVGGGAALSFLPGFLQGLALRRQVGRSRRWALVSAVAFFVASILSLPTMVAFARTFGRGLPSAEAWALNGALTGLISGAITGAALVRLLRPPAPAVAEERARWSRVVKVHLLERAPDITGDRLEP
jgi:hypothetical protein